MTLLGGKRYVVEAHGIAAGYAGWLLRQLGAIVECETALDPEGIGAFLTPHDPIAARPKVACEPGGILVTDAPPTSANRDRLGRASESATVIWITPWGRDSEWSNRPDTDLLLYAASGWMSAVGEPGREPLAPPGGQARFTAGLCAAVAALADEAGAPHAPGIVDVPVIEALAATLIYDPIGFQYYGNVRQRVANRYSANQPTITTLPCRDGWIGIHAALHWQWLTLCELIGHPELVQDPRFASPADRAKNIADLDSYLLPWLADRTRWEAFHELQGARIPCSASPTMEEVLASPQLKARNSWAESRTPSGRRLRVPGSPFRASEATGGSINGRRHADGPWNPGALRVVDLSMGWAGPLAGHALAALGADVIKVESHTHFDWWRGSRPPGDGAGLGLHERSHVFNAVNRGKRGITLNLATPRGNELARELIRDADVVIENFGAGIIEKLGLTYEALSRENPGLIMLRQPGFGSTGPESGYVAFGNTIEGMAGLTALVGYDNDGPPYMLSNALGDPISGFTGAAAILAAMHARTADGRGRLIECAQLEGFLPFTSEALIDHQRTGRQPARAGNSRPDRAPSGVYRCAGDDEWLALEVRTDAEWRALSDAISEPWAAAIIGLNTQEERARAAELDRELRAWFAGQDRDGVLARLVAAGVPAAPVLSEPGVLALEPLAASGFWVGEEREPVGFHLYPSLPIIASGAHYEVAGPAPHLGQHTEEVLRGMGLGDGDLAELESAGVTGSV